MLERFAHLFKPSVNTEEIAKIQAIADANAEKYGIDSKIQFFPNKRDDLENRCPIFHTRLMSW